MGRFDDYCSYLSKYIALYGDKTTVLYQCGMFHEIYGVDNDTEMIGNAKKLSDLLGIQLTRVKKSITENSKDNPQMTGFPSVNIDKYIMILLQNNWTVVVVDQQKDNKGDITRKVSNIWSPGTYVKNPIDTNNFIVSVSIKCVPQKLSGDYSLYHIGLSCIDVTTGISRIHECFSNQQDSNYAIDETVRFIQAHQPKEILFDHDPSEISENQIEEMFDLSYIKVYYNPDITKGLSNITLQETYLSDIFKDHGIISTIEYLNLERYPEARQSYVTLLRFCEAHSRSIIGGLKEPMLLDSDKLLVLDNNAVTQLNIVKSPKSVINIMTATSTNMGKRLVKERILNPISDVNEINKRYMLVDFMKSTNLEKTRWSTVEKYLKNFVDSERYHRKIAMKILEPSELSSLIQTYNDSVTMFQDLEETPLKFNQTEILKGLVNHLSKCIDEEESSKYNLNDITDSFFKRGYNNDIDSLSDKIRLTKRQLSLISSKMSDMISGKNGGEYVKLKRNDKSGYYLDVTKPRFSILSKSFASFKISDDIVIDNINVFTLDKKNKSNVKISGGPIAQLSDRLEKHIEQLKTVCTNIYIDLLDKLYVEYSKFYPAYDNHVASIDLYKSSAKISDKNGYCKPQIITDSKQSQINATDLRHPIIEKIVRKTKYIPTNVSLNENGILLYGINASGKSSTMKAVGISLILAQAGFFVPARKYSFYPYQTIMTRIVGNDDLFKGLSSFAVEMSELRGILSRANSKTLVLGDEICHGTETGSAISIVAASLIELSRRKSSYIFATHLHQLSKMEEVCTISNLKQYHLTMHYDEKLDEIIYDRILKEGPGPSNYGIEVARAMKIPQSIIDCSNLIRNKYFGIPTSIKTSRYNARSLMKKCQIDDCCNKSEDSHHIRFQCEAGSNSCLATGEHKNNISNLVSLCKIHHNMVHQPTDKKLIIFGYTESGKLRYSFRTPLKSFGHNFKEKN